jgi:cytochrome P450
MTLGGTVGGSRDFDDPAGEVAIPGGADEADPYPGFAELRVSSPVLNVGPSEISGGGDTYFAVRYEDVERVLRDESTFSARPSGESMRETMGWTILGMDGAEHLRHRSLVAQAFRPKLLQRWEDELIRPLVNELVDRFAADGKAELVRQLLLTYPMQVIARILGVPKEDAEQFEQWGVWIIASAVNPERGKTASQAMRDYLVPLLAERRREPADDVISQLVRAELDGEVLSDEEILPFLLLLLPAGGETTYRATGNLLYGLLTHPDQLEAVRRDRSLMRPTIDEALRWEPPLLILAREALVDTELAGVPIPKGAHIAISQGAANRDPAFVPEPDRFDIARGSRAHLSFGNGPHMCLGMHLARMEMSIVLDVILDRLPNLRLDPEAMAGEAPPSIRGMAFRSPTALPVLFDAAPSHQGKQWS